MTIREIAARLGVSVPTLYRRLKQEGIDIKTLRDEKTNRVTAEGASVIADLIGSIDDNTAVQDIIEGASQSVADDTSQYVIELKVRLAAAEATIDGLRALIDQLTSERDRLAAALAAEQADRASERRLLAASVEDAEQSRGGFWRRLFHR